MPRKIKAEGAARAMKEKSSPAMEGSTSTTWAGLAVSLPHKGGGGCACVFGWGD